MVGFFVGYCLGWFWVGFVMSFHVFLSWFLLLLPPPLFFFFFFGLKIARGRERVGGREREDREKVDLNNQIEIYINRVNIHGYCSYLYMYCDIDPVSNFWAKMCKIHHFFYFSLTNDCSSFNEYCWNLKFNIDTQSLIHVVSSNQ